MRKVSSCARDRARARDDDRRSLRGGGRGCLRRDGGGQPMAGSVSGFAAAGSFALAREAELTFDPIPSFGP